nr:chromate transporter [uncultured Romboutsia sp.]
MKELMNLFWSFCRIGGLTFGGGYAMLPMLQKEVVETHKWATEQELLDYYAVGQATPGVIAVNTATFIGYKEKGILGAIFATSGVVFPSLAIIMSIAGFIDSFSDLNIVQHAFSGIRVAVGVLILNALVNLVKGSVKDILGIILFVATFIISIFFNISVVYIVVASALIGIISDFVNRKRGIKQ